jgi:predicted nucleotidyltransferase
VVLFGSKARGAGDEDSDIDLLVLTKWKLDWRAGFRGHHT